MRVSPWLLAFVLGCFVAVDATVDGSSGPARYTGTLYVTSKTSVTYKPGVLDKTAGTAYATFDDGEYSTSLNGTGWGVLYLNLRAGAADTLDDATLMYAAGYLEGAITYQQITNHYNNYMFDWFGGVSKVPKSVKNFMTSNLQYARDQVAANPSDSYWGEVNLLLNQVDGMVAGYNAVSGASLTAYDFHMMNADGDLLDITEAYGVTLGGPKAGHRRRLGGTGGVSGHCSAAVRVLPNNADLYFSHDTWNDYGQMVRIYKFYDFPLARGTRQISFSSYPGFIASIDDWYLTHNGLAVTETTNEYYNKTMDNEITPTGCLLTFWRSMLANYNAKNGPDWISWFCKENSGTYDNQWMIINLNLFTPGMSTLPANLLWVTEQIWGMCQSADVTSTLKSTGYWASYNIPYFPYIYQVSGFQNEYNKYGDEYSYSQNSRAKIFARDMVTLTDYAGFQKVMDSNNYKNDPYCNGAADEAIMARGDLIKSFPVPSGAIDSKTSTWAKGLKLECDAKNGPTHQTLPVFNWNQFSDVPHAGQPEAWDFDYVAMSPSNADVPTFPVRVPAPAIYASHANVFRNDDRPVLAAVEFM